MIPPGLSGMLPRSMLPGPAAALEPMIRTASKLLVGRYVRLPGTALSMRVDEVDFRPDPMGLTLGQYGDVGVVAGDVVWQDLRAVRMQLRGHNVHLQPGSRPTVVIAPVDVEIALTRAAVTAWVADRCPALVLEVEGAAGSGRAFVRWVRRPGWGAVEITAESTGSSLLLRPVGLRVGARLLRRAVPARPTCAGPRPTICCSGRPGPTARPPVQRADRQAGGVA